jgi:protein-tyrosine phosphatase
MKEIVKNLFQGDQKDAEAAAATGSVDWIIYLGQELPHKLAYDSSVPVIHIPIKDNEDIMEKWRVANAIIAGCHSGLNGEGTKTLIACRQGISRSPMMIVFYLMKSNQFKDRSFSKVYRFVDKRCILGLHPEPNLYKMIKEEFG